MRIMTPSEKMMTQGQISKAVQNYRVMLEKHAFEFPSEPTQLALGQFELAREQFEVFRRRVELFSDLIIRQATVVTPQGETKEVEVVFFKPNRLILNDDELTKEYDLRGLCPADLSSLSAINQADPSFSNEKPNATHHKGPDGRWYYATFDQSEQGCVGVSRYGYKDRAWWFAGVRK
jgi:hypothetical protein